MNNNNFFIKISLVGIAIVLAIISVFLYLFLFTFDPFAQETQIPKLPSIDIKTYQRVIPSQ